MEITWEDEHVTNWQNSAIILSPLFMECWDKQRETNQLAVRQTGWDNCTAFNITQQQMNSSHRVGRPNSVLKANVHQMCISVQIIYWDSLAWSYVISLH